MNKSYNLPLTKEEIKAIQDLKNDKLNTLQKNRWNMEPSTEQLEKLILKFVNIYSAIYKAGDRSGINRLYRGTSQSEIKEIQKYQYIQNVISTTVEEESAKIFTPYGEKASILRIKLEENLPFLNIEAYRDENRKDEKKVLILPFTKVKKIEETSKWNGYVYYDAILEKEELEQIPEQELKTLEAQLIEGYDHYREQATECLALEDTLNVMYLQLTQQQGLSKNDRQYLSEQLNQKISKYTEVTREVKEYQKQFSRMLKGMCKEKELEIDRQKNEKEEEIKTQQKAKQEDEKKKLEAEIRKLEEELQFGRLNIIGNLEEDIRRIEANADMYQSMAEDLKIGYSMNLHFSVLENVEKIKNILKEDTVRETQEESEKQEQHNQEDTNNTKLQKRYQELLSKKQQLITIKQMMQGFPDYIEEHNKESFQEIKANLNARVQEIITQTRIEHLRTEKQQISQEKDSIFQKFFYGTSLKEQKMANLDAKIEWEKGQNSMRNPANSVKMMMYNLYDCSIQDLQRKIFSRDA